MKKLSEELEQLLQQGRGRLEAEERLKAAHAQAIRSQESLAASRHWEALRHAVCGTIPRALWRYCNLSVPPTDWLSSRETFDLEIVLPGLLPVQSTWVAGEPADSWCGPPTTWRLYGEGKASWFVENPGGEDFALNDLLCALALAERETKRASAAGKEVPLTKHS